jgi:hypothetical protein
MSGKKKAKGVEKGGLLQLPNGVGIQKRKILERCAKSSIVRGQLRFERAKVGKVFWLLKNRKIFFAD